MPIKEDNNTITSFLLEGCKKVTGFENIDKLKNLASLHYVNCGSVKSIKHLNKLSNLTELLMHDTNIVDGDTLLFEKMHSFTFDDKKHYNLKYSDLYKSRAIKSQTGANKH